ncbi:hypothetical protein DMB38_20030 [Streptomyces sp. WAC 06738]|uniref:hypothetical protein n=1 Tax=Streptomyces sp. WAC 06738 TaxID=2203210 RepID=UPI000F6D3016|nr:hypothetical protein [Streptomyces sp. WAC 06738]AZM47767.1 hypothetical protein DMB38_20030 [Streptomyces sp. WAC 06738]
MPKATSLSDRRRHGRGDNSSRVVSAKANQLDQRTAARYAPKAPSTKSEFDAGASAGTTMSRGVPAGGSKKRAAPAVRKLGVEK